MADTTLAFDILARDRASKVFGDVGKSADGLGSKFTKVGKIAATAVAGAAVAAVAGLGAAMVQGVKDAVSYETLQKKTEAVLRSTGNAANTTVKDIQGLAGELESLSGVDEELIINSQNVLATFTKIQNVGKDRIFDQATKSALDMSVALGQDLQGATTMVGKALNDPIKGIAAMGRAGVQFTEEQKNLIKTLVESGDTLGAQKVILGELETQFGGAGKAAGSGFAGDLARLKDAFSDTFRELGTRLLPTISSLVGWLGDKLPGALDVVAGLFDTVKSGVSAFFDAVREGDVTSDGFVGVMESIGDAIHRALPTLKAIIGAIRDNLTPILAGFGAVVGVVVVASLWSAVAALGALLSPAVLVLGAVAALAAGVVYAYQNFDTFRAIVDAVAGFLTGTVWPAIQAFASGVAEQFGNLVEWTRQHWDAISEAIGHVLEVVKAIVGAAVEAISGAWRLFGDNLLNIAKVAFDYIKQTIENVLGVIRGIIDTVLALINGDWGKAWDGIKSIVSAVWDQIKNVVSTAVDLLGQVVSIGMDAVKAGFGAAWDAIKTAASVAVEAVVGFVRAVPGKLLEFAGAMLGAGAGLGGKFLDGLKNGLTAAAGFAGDIAAGIVGVVKGAWNTVAGMINDFVPNSIGWGPFSLDLPDNPIPQFRAMGGPVGAGMPYTVGENGPETFVPNQSGSVMPFGGFSPDELGRQIARAYAAELRLQMRTA